MGVTNQEITNRAAFDHQPGPGDPRNEVLTDAKRKHDKYDAISSRQRGLTFLLPLETTGEHGASTATVYFPFTKHLRDSGLPADVLVDKLKKDISVALRRGTTAQVTTHALDG